MRERELQRRQQEASGLQQNFFACKFSKLSTMPYTYNYIFANYLVCKISCFVLKSSTMSKHCQE